MTGRKTYHHGDLKNALIRAGAEILAAEGVGGLSLRKVAKWAGVSHAAPYAHFADKQSLIAAISTEGFRQLDGRISAIAERHSGDPARQVVEAAWAYAAFAQEDPGRFRLMFSSVLEKEKEYPEFVEATGQNFERVVGIVEACQRAGILRPGPAELMAVAVWGQVHGIIALALEGQISHVVTKDRSLREIIVFALNQITLTELDFRFPRS